MIALIVVVLVVVVIAGLAIDGFFYRGLNKLRGEVDEAWAALTVRLDRRSDLVAPLVETAAGYAPEDMSTLDAARGAAEAARSTEEPRARARAEADVEVRVQALTALGDTHPDLKADQTFGDLGEKLHAAEAEITRARGEYNEVVATYNTKIETPPTSIIARVFNFEGREPFETS